ncbi:hypothetical protein J5N97_005418 [Dioscorea zingiberensis]|uniref:Leucine-rich repeat-containing N-terminal plant-type domain-containing protein n=1 Tax=Dioscorea zingiberensis TaxID=325984 RepID=A0A9D5HT24_9LILI|nr:hypothetical protein J5N97_005418 [Dioscorea zingiberensis]
MASRFHSSLLLLPLFFAAAVFAGCHPSDHTALLSIRDALTEPSLGVFSSWTGSECCSRWHGVSCDPKTGRVADLSLRGESEDPILTRSGLMTGKFSPSVCRLSSLSSRIIADWKQISGPIPSCIPSSLPSLRILDLIGNRLSGPLPSDIGRLCHLTVLNVADNQISGKIPRSLPSLSSLMHLDLSNNLISGPILMG